MEEQLSVPPWALIGPHSCPSALGRLPWGRKGRCYGDGERCGLAAGLRHFCLFLPHFCLFLPLFLPLFAPFLPQCPPILCLLPFFTPLGPFSPHFCPTFPLFYLHSLPFSPFPPPRAHFPPPPHSTHFFLKTFIFSVAAQNKPGVPPPETPPRDRHFMGRGGESCFGVKKLLCATLEIGRAHV